MNPNNVQRGIGTVVAVIDTGLNPASMGQVEILPGVNFSHEGGPDDTRDNNGHGTAVAATLAAQAQSVRLLPVKLLGEHANFRSIAQLEAVFDWIIEQREPLGIGIVCAAFADTRHLADDGPFRASLLQEQIACLREAGVATVAPAGNHYRRQRMWNPQGMAWPAILREVVSVGAAECGADGVGLAEDSQRLHVRWGDVCHTTVFAIPGEPGGTSGAAAVVAGRLAILRAECPEASVCSLIERLLAPGAFVREANSLLEWPLLGSLP